MAFNGYWFNLGGDSEATVPIPITSGKYGFGADTYHISYPFAETGYKQLSFSVNSISKWYFPGLSPSIDKQLDLVNVNVGIAYACTLIPNGYTSIEEVRSIYGESLKRKLDDFISFGGASLTKLNKKYVSLGGTTKRNSKEGGIDLKQWIKENGLDTLFTAPVPGLLNISPGFASLTASLIFNTQDGNILKYNSGVYHETDCVNLGGIGQLNGCYVVGRYIFL